MFTLLNMAFYGLTKENPDESKCSVHTAEKHNIDKSALRCDMMLLHFAYFWVREIFIDTEKRNHTSGAIDTEMKTKQYSPLNHIRENRVISSYYTAKYCERFAPLWGIVNS